MYKVLVVDDEPWVAYGIAHLIDWETNGFEVVGEAYDGVTALQLIEQHAPHVVVSDIRMPGLDGIQLLEKLKEKELEVEVVLISGYSEFQYAQQALRLGAFDYLLKQVEAEQLLDTVQRVKERLHTRQRSLQQLDLFLHDMFELLEPSSGMTIGEFAANKGGALTYPDFRFIGCQHDRSASMLLPAFEQQFSGIKTLHLRTGLNQWALLVNYDEADNTRNFLDYLSNLIGKVQHAGISSKGSSSTLLAQLYQESEIALCSAIFYQYEQLMQYKPGEPDNRDNKMVLQMELAVKEGDRAKISELLAEWERRCKEERIAVDRLAMIYNQFISLLLKYYRSSADFIELEHLSFDQLVRHYRSHAGLFSRLGALFEQTNDKEAYISNDQAQKIIAFIDGSYTEDILLGALAKQFNLSIGYLSMLIKKETGKTYSEYVTDKRLALAKELLGDPASSIHEIVQRVGYKDYFHFNKLFKKHFGITPSKYRKL